MTLHELALIPENATDKQDSNHVVFGENYLHIYERYFEPVRSTVTSVLEIGVLGGHSLRLWRDYFPLAQITGMDIDPARAGTESRIESITGDQSDSADLAAIASRGPFDIIIDDGSHISSHIIISLDHLWPHLKPGGFYCLEDMGCTYNGTDDGWPGMTYNKCIPPDGNRSLINEALLARVQQMDFRSGGTRAIHIHPMLVIIQKV